MNGYYHLLITLSLKHLRLLFIDWSPTSAGTNFLILTAHEPWKQQL